MYYEWLLLVFLFIKQQDDTRYNKISKGEKRNSGYYREEFCRQKE